MPISETNGPEKLSVARNLFATWLRERPVIGGTGFERLCTARKLASTSTTGIRATGLSGLQITVIPNIVRSSIGTAAVQM